MKLFARLRALVARHVKVEVIPPGACHLCRKGPNPTQGVPVQLLSGQSAHLLCLAREQHAKPMATYAEAAAQEVDKLRQSAPWN